MKVNKDKMSIAEIAHAIGMSEQIVRNWVLWYERNKGKRKGFRLPKCTWIKCGSREYRAYKKEDVEVFRQFKEQRLKRWGVMSQYNAERNWGKYGKSLIENKNRRKENARAKRNKVAGNKEREH